MRSERIEKLDVKLKKQDAISKTWELDFEYIWKLGLPWPSFFFINLSASRIDISSLNYRTIFKTS